MSKEADTKHVDLNDERSVRNFIRRHQLRSLLYIVFSLALVSWWQQGFRAALVGGVALYGLLALMLFVGYWIDAFIRKRRRR